MQEENSMKMENDGIIKCFAGANLNAEIRSYLDLQKDQIAMQVREYDTKIDTMDLAIKNLMNGQPDLSEIDHHTQQEKEKIFRESELTTQLSDEIERLRRILNDQQGARER